MDVSLNKPFKVKGHYVWNRWMVNDPEELAKAGNLKQPGIGWAAGLLI